jgi:hypothetical protein
MGKVVFDADDIHKMRLEVAEQYAKMTKEDARRDMHEHAENTRHRGDTPQERFESGIGHAKENTQARGKQPSRLGPVMWSDFI